MSQIVNHLPCFYFAGHVPCPHFQHLPMSCWQAPVPAAVIVRASHLFSDCQIAVTGMSCAIFPLKCDWQRAADAQIQGHVPLKCWVGEKTLFPCCLWPGRVGWVQRPVIVVVWLSCADQARHSPWLTLRPFVIRLFCFPSLITNILC